MLVSVYGYLAVPEIRQASNGSAFTYFLLGNEEFVFVLYFYSSF
jgi:hypothetical protein